MIPLEKIGSERTDFVCLFVLILVRKQREEMSVELKIQRWK